MTALADAATAPGRLTRPVVAASVAAGLAMTAMLASEPRWLPALLMAVASLAAALTPALRLPGALIGMLAILAVLNGASIAWNWYVAWTPFDEWAHLVNPVALVAPSMIWLWRAGWVDARPDGPRFVLAATAYGFVLAIGWEVIEAYIWAFPWIDTVTDILLGTLGSTLAGWWVGWTFLRAEAAGPNP